MDKCDLSIGMPVKEQMNINRSVVNEDLNSAKFNIELLDTLDRFMAVLFHDINNPLGTALSTIQIASRHNTNHTASEWLSYAEASIRLAATATKRMQALCELDGEHTTYSVTNAVHAAIDFVGFPKTRIELQQDGFDFRVVGKPRALVMSLAILFNHAQKSFTRFITLKSSENQSIFHLTIRIDSENTTPFTLPRHLRKMIRELIVNDGTECRFARTRSSVKVLLNLPIAVEKCQNESN